MPVEERVLYDRLITSITMALHKTVPVPVIETAEGWDCPICKVALHGTRYCPNCGQRLDWRQDDD